MLASLFLAFGSALAQESTAIPPTPFDRVVELEVDPADPVLEGKGPWERVEYETRFSGTLYIWTKAEGIDPFLRVEDASGAVLEEDDDGGGEPTPCVALEVEPGQALAVIVALKDRLDAPRRLELHLVAAPESEATRAAAARGRALLEEAKALEQAGERARSRSLLEETLAGLQATDGAESSARIAGVLWDLGSSARDFGALETARRAFGAARNHRERTLPEDHPDLLEARGNLGNTLGDLPGARQLEERVLASFERTLPEDHPDLFAARVNLAGTMYQMGDLPRARELLERALAGYERMLPEDHPDLLGARANLAGTMYQMGDLPGARELIERVLAGYERTLPEDHPLVLMIRANLAGTMFQMGDLAGARELLERVLAGYERTLPEDHPDFLRARMGLASTMKGMGDLADARDLYVRVLAGYGRTLPEDHPDFLAARLNLADTMNQMGDLAGARELQERVLATFERIHPDDHPDLLAARLNLAETVFQMGDLQGARDLLSELVAGMLRRTLSALLLAPREARELVGTDANRLAAALFLSGSSGTDELGRTSLFELVETRRLVASEAARAASLVAADAGLVPLSHEAADARTKLNDLVAGAAREGMPAEALRAELARESERRDRAEREIARVLAGRGLVAEAITARALTAALSERHAAVGYLRYPHFEPDQERSTGDHLLAHVLQPDGSLARVELGPAAELERRVAAWRGALGSSIGRGTGVAAEELPEDAEPDAGRALRERLVDPILSACEGVTTLFVSPDDLVFLVPLDALPLEDGRVGDRIRIVSESSFGRLIQPAAPLSDGERGFLALGGVDYAAEPAPETLAASAAVAAAIEATLRGGEMSTFAPLAATAEEVEALSRLFDRAFDEEPVVLVGERANKAALFERAPHARYLHLATHGWFAAESVKSISDPPAGERSSWQSMSVEETVTGFAPMTLCGLALAGASRGRDSLGRVPGILTAEELSSLDLTQCELAVLSACETNVGIRRAGQGIQSLQAALHAAGARTAITSLWKVDDAATRKLMERFYTYFWMEKLPKAEALWKAKCDLRAEGYPVRDWAAWVLSGDPD